MKALLGSFMILATFVASCNAYCYFTHLKKPSYECTDADGETHPINSIWEKNCEECFCSTIGIVCCSRITKPVGYEENKCYMIFHETNCTYTVVEKKNPERACKVEGWIL